MLELDLDLEADLGIDTVKQAKVFALARETFNIPRQHNVLLRDYPRPSCHRVRGAESAGFGRARSAGAGSAGSCGAESATATATTTTTTGNAVGSGNPIEEKVLELVAGKTGYPRDMLELDLDLEADPGHRHGQAGGGVRAGAGVVQYSAPGRCEAAGLPDPSSRHRVREQVPAGNGTGSAGSTRACSGGANRCDSRSRHGTGAEPLCERAAAPSSGDPAASPRLVQEDRRASGKGQPCGGGG